MENKTKHNRQNIVINKSILNNVIEKDKTLNNNPKKEINPITNNYLEQMRKIYELDKDIMINENNLLRQKTNSNKNLYIHKINNLKNKLN